MFPGNLEIISYYCSTSILYYIMKDNNKNLPILPKNHHLDNTAIRKEIQQVRNMLAYTDYLTDIRMQKTKLPFMQYFKATAKKRQALWMPENTSETCNWAPKKKEHSIKLTIPDNPATMALNTQKIQEPEQVQGPTQKKLLATYKKHTDQSEDDTSLISPEEMHHEIKLNLLDTVTQFKVERITNDSLDNCSLRKNEPLESKRNERGSNFKLRRLPAVSRIFEKTEHLHFFSSSKEQMKQKSHASLHLRTMNRSDKSLKSVVLAPNADLSEVMRRFGVKMSELNINKGHLMTNTRQEAIFFNELVKEVGKTRNFVKLAALVKDEAEKMKKSMLEQKEKQKEKENPGLVKLSIHQLAVKNALENRSPNFYYMCKAPLQKM